MSEGKDTLWQRGFDPSSLIGYVLAGKYKVARYIGGGGFGIVYEGANVNLPNLKVVIKFLRPASQSTAKDRFIREGEILCQLDHPNICRIIDFLPEDNALIMQYIDGMNGEQILESAGPLDGVKLLAIARSLCNAMSYAHSKGIAHRDIKPGNIIIDSKGQMWLIDFGIAKEMHATSLTDTGLPPFTPQYAAPERSAQKQYDPYLSDIYEIGATICRLATGMLPQQALYPVPGQRSGPGKRRHFSRAMKKILRKATQLMPEDRYRSVADMAADLQKVDRIFSQTRLRTVGVVAIVIVAVLAIWKYQDPLRQVLLSFTDKPAHVTSDSAEIPKPMPGTDSGQSRIEKAESLHAVIPPFSIIPTPNDGKRSDTLRTPPAENPTVTISVDPEANSILLIDQKQHAFDRAIRVEQGRHEIQITNPDYPIWRDTIYVEASLKYRKALSDLCANQERVHLLIGQGPKLSKAMATISTRVNGAKRQMQTTVDDIPYLIFCRGSWKLEFHATDVRGSEHAIDSIMTFPYSDDGPRKTFKSNTLEIDLESAEWQRLKEVKITVF